MTIETKYNIGDEVFTLYNNKVSTLKIWGIDVSIEKGFDGQYVLPTKVKILYYDFGKHHTFNEQDLFPTKEELLKSL